MYDVLRARYTFACPAREHASVPLSAFREVERLPGAAHPAVFRVRFACACGDEHDGLLSHDDLDWAPLGVGEEREFVNLMTARRQLLGEELNDLAARLIAAGGWPWVLFCYPEGKPRPAFPSLFRLMAPKAEQGAGRRGAEVLELRASLGQPRIPRARRRAVPSRRRGRGRRAAVSRGRAADARGLPSGALVCRVRLAASSACVDGPDGRSGGRTGTSRRT